MTDNERHPETQASMERVARFLDGENVSLTPAEEALAREVRGDQAMLSQAMQACDAAEMQSRQREAVDKARRRMLAALAKPSAQPAIRRMTLRIAFATATAAAAVILLAVALYKPQSPPDPTAGANNTPAPVVAGDDGQEEWVNYIPEEESDPQIIQAVMALDKQDADPLLDNGSYDLSDWDMDI